jgi:hypothetical protein
VKKIIVALDIGTKTGVATFGLDGQLLTRNTLELDKGYQARDLFNALRKILTPNMMVAWEEPFGRHGQHVMQRLAGAVQCACELVGCDDVPVNLVTVKKHATGYGLAGKDAMTAAAVRKWGGEFNEHEADAAWVGQSAIDLVLDTPTKEEEMQ